MSISLTCALGRSAARVAAGFILFGASAALAGTIGVTFNGPSDTAGKHWGVSSTTASSAQGNGISVLSGAPMFNADGNIKVKKQNLSSISLSKDDLDTPLDVSSEWTTKAQRNLKGSEVFLVFTSIDPRTIKVGKKEHDVNYDPTMVGLKLDSSAGWVLFQSTSPGLGTVYYPAIRLGPIGEGKKKEIDIPYHLQQLITFDQKKGNSTIVPLPKLRIGVALAPIPEPTAGLLMGAGLIGLAIRARNTRSS